MDYIKNLAGGGSKSDNAPQQTQESSSSGGGLMDRVNGALGGGPQSEANEDYLDKGLLPSISVIPLFGPNHCNQY
jgi:hypothetical protein